MTTGCCFGRTGALWSAFCFTLAGKYFSCLCAGRDRARASHSVPPLVETAPPPPQRSNSCRRRARRATAAARQQQKWPTCSGARPARRQPWRPALRAASLLLIIFMARTGRPAIKSYAEVGRQPLACQASSSSNWIDQRVPANSAPAKRQLNGERRGLACARARARLRAAGRPVGQSAGVQLPWATKMQIAPR
jgi:hypothetical protein